MKNEIKAEVTYSMSEQTAKFIQALNEFDKCTALMDDAFALQYGIENSMPYLQDYLREAGNVRDFIVQRIGGSLIENIENKNGKV